VKWPSFSLIYFPYIIGIVQATGKTSMLTQKYKSLVTINNVTSQCIMVMGYKQHKNWISLYLDIPNMIYHY